MTLLKTKHYDFRLFEVLVGAAIMAAFLVSIVVSIDSTLDRGIAMVVPIFVFITMSLDYARVDKRPRFFSWRGWIEVLVAFAIAASIPYLGYKLWLMGY